MTGTWRTGLALYGIFKSPPGTTSFDWQTSKLLTWALN
jgi:hypothetical protein